MHKNTDRRTFLIHLIAGASLGASWFWGDDSDALAMGAVKIPQGVIEIQGEATINNQPAMAGAIVKPGDSLTTGPDSSLIFVINESVHLLRAKTNIQVAAPAPGKTDKPLHEIRIASGKMLAVFRRNRKRLVTPTAVIGVRGSGIYLEVEPERTYVCLCYGVADIMARHTPDIKETVQTTHHEAPRYIYAPGTERLIVPAGLVNHSDSELVMLEKIAGRRPPFVINAY